MPAAFNLEGINIPRHYNLTALDKAYVLINYPRAQAAAATPEWTFEHALDVARVDAATKAKLLQDFNAKNYDGVRTKFNQWNAIMQAGAGN